MNPGDFYTTIGYTLRNEASLIRGGSAYFNALETLIQNAQKSIHFQVYIFDDDETGQRIAKALTDASNRGVKVHLLIDGYASQYLSNSFIQNLTKSGIHFRWFEPVFRGKTFYFGRRMHHKMVVADGSTALVGGMNISNRYNDLPDRPAWLDWAVLVSGEIATKLDVLSVKMWNRSALVKTKLALPVPAVNRVSTECMVRMRRNDWIFRKIEISGSYLEMFRKAEKEIIIMSGYFLPGLLIRKALTRAAKRGVEISIIIAGESDIKMAKAAERYWYPFLFRHKIRIYEYQTGILHGKMSVYDEKWATIGSYNVNNISAYASIELNLDILNQPFGKTATDELKKIITNNCIEITAERYSKQTILNRFIYWWSYEVYRLVLFLFTFYFKQQHKE